jgi:phospholipid-binding lipoprotein MlaA
MRLGLAALGLAAMLSACATAPAGGVVANPKDPWEATNRKVFAFNDRLDLVVLKPLAEGYQAVVPMPVRDAVGNFFSNLSDAWSSVNWLLQGEVQRSLEQGARFAWNSTLGVGGLFDVSSSMGLDRRNQDFGQTLGTWGVGLGPYVVLPVLGPSSLRDVAALPVNRAAFGTSFISDGTGRVALAALEVVSLRASLLAAERIVSGIALDKYTFFRDAYLQRRGNQPDPDDDEGFEIVTPPATPKPNP